MSIIKFLALVVLYLLFLHKSNTYDTNPLPGEVQKGTALSTYSGPIIDGRLLFRKGFPPKVQSVRLFINGAEVM